jgi:predicted O-methyltransferase YrrM
MTSTPYVVVAPLGVMSRDLLAIRDGCLAVKDCVGEARERIGQLPDHTTAGFRSNSEPTEGHCVSAPPELPDVVNRAFDVSRKAGYVSFCRNETGRLLAMLAATRGGTMAEFGTGCGVGTAWLRSGVRGDRARILTAELDPKLAGAAQEIFQDDPQVEVLAADWSTLLDKGPFSLLFLDSGQPTEVGVDAVADLVEEGGIVVLDDFTPCEIWPPVTGGRVDTLREEWLTDERFTTVEVMVATDASTLIATRR